MINNSLRACRRSGRLQQEMRFAQFDVITENAKFGGNNLFLQKLFSWPFEVRRPFLVFCIIRK